MASFLPLSTILFYCLFTTFVFYQTLHLKYFRGASAIFRHLLLISAFSGTVVGLVYLFYYGFSVAWWAPVVVFVIGLASQLVANFVETFTGPFLLSIAGFLGWPICAYLMFTTLP